MDKPMFQRVMDRLPPEVIPALLARLHTTPRTVRQLTEYDLLQAAYALQD